MKRTQAPDESSDLRLSYKTVLSYVGAIVVVVGGETFGLTKLSIIVMHTKRGGSCVSS